MLVLTPPSTTATDLRDGVGSAYTYRAAGHHRRAHGRTCRAASNRRTNFGWSVRGGLHGALSRMWRTNARVSMP